MKFNIVYAAGNFPQLIQFTWETVNILRNAELNFKFAEELKVTK